jgi:hypothetical protein
MAHIENSVDSEGESCLSADPVPNHDRESLRQEIVESEKSQADFLKWKFIIVAAVGSLSLGFSSSTNTGSPSVRAQSLLCLIPLICAYVDLISLHIMVRVRTIGAFLKETGSDYEKFVSEVRQRTGANPYGFETLALHGSSFLLNVLLLGLGFVAFCVHLASSSAATSGAQSLSASSFEWVPGVLVAYMIAGAAGLGATAVFISLYRARNKDIDQFAREYLKRCLQRSG